MTKVSTGGTGGGLSPLDATELPTGTQALIHDPFDVASFRTAIQGFDRFRQEVTGVISEFPTGASLVRDAFWSYQQYQPLPTDEVTPAHMINKALVDELMSTGGWRDLRADTQDDPVASAIATMSVLPRMVNALDAQTRKRLRELGEAEEALNKLMEDAASWRELANERPNKAEEFERRAQEAEAAAAPVEQHHQELQQAVSQALEQQADAMRSAARQAMQSAGEEITSLNAAMDALEGSHAGGSGAGFGLAGGSSTAAGSIKQKIQMAHRMGQSPIFRRVVEIAGRFQRIAHQTQREKLDQAREEIVGIELGADLSLVLPIELVFADDEVLGLEFDRRFTERQLQQYKVTGTDELGRGPIVCVIDDSGSMRESFGGHTKEVWAKGAMLGLLTVAKMQKRELAVLHFSGKGQTKLFRFPKGKPVNQGAMVDCIEWFFGGGTDLESALGEALGLVDESEYNKADIVLISDGITMVSPEMTKRWNGRRTERGMQTFSILIGTNEGRQVLEPISNEVMTLNPGNDSNILKTIYGV